MSDKVIYVRGKPVKFVRYGGLSPVIQEGYRALNPTFHSPPRRKGFYAFVWPYIDKFLIGSPTWSGVTAKYSKFVFVRDKQNNVINDKHPEYEKLASRGNKFWSVASGLDAEGYPLEWRLVKPKPPKTFVYTGELWHHLGEHLTNRIYETKGTWTKSSYAEFCYALGREFHDMGRSMITTTQQRWRLSKKPNAWYTVDHLEVFIERI